MCPELFTVSKKYQTQISLLGKGGEEKVRVMKEGKEKGLWEKG